MLDGILCLFPLPWLRQVVAANSKHSRLLAEILLVFPAPSGLSTPIAWAGFFKNQAANPQMLLKIILFLTRITARPLICFFRASDL